MSAEVHEVSQSVNLSDDIDVDNAVAVCVLGRTRISYPRFRPLVSRKQKTTEMRRKRTAIMGWRK